MSTSRGLYNLVIVTARKRKDFGGWRLRGPRARHQGGDSHVYLCDQDST